MKTTSPSSADDDVEKDIASSSHAKNKDDERRRTFVDYVAPDKSIPPPAKWKLALLIFTGVYFSLWFQGEAGFVAWMIQTLHLRPDDALFLFLWIAVGCLSYGYLDVLNFVLRVKINGEWYGVVSWLQQPRIQWVHEYQNFWVVCVRIFVTTMEDGLSIFNVPPAEAPSAASKQKVFETEEHNNEQVLLRIEQHIQEGKVHEYVGIRDRLIEAMEMRANPGILKMETEGSTAGTSTCVFEITFRTIDDLNDFMTSPIRQRLIRQIQPLLETRAHVQLLKEREMPDAFTDLVNQQGQPVPERQPKKWKTWFLSTLSIYLVILYTNHAIPHYLRAWGLDHVHERIRTIVTIAINVLLNAYIVTPFLTSMVFGLWLHRPQRDEEGDRREPWRTLNDGFRTIWGKIAMCLAFYGGLALAWAI